MKKRKIILLQIAVLLSVVNSFTIIPVNAQIYTAKDTKMDDILRNSEVVTQRSISTSQKKQNAKNKKSLKKEIQNRKKYHKTILSLYNEHFDPKYLELMHENALIIEQLEVKRIS